MPTLEELLAAMPDDDGGEGQQAPSTPAPAQEDNSSFRALRDQAKRLERDNKKLENELEELRKFREETTARERSNSLAQAGLSPRQSEAFLKLYEDVTPENVSAFKAEVLGQSQDETPPAPFAPTGYVGERSTTKMSRQEFEALFKTNPAKAREVMESNGVAWERDVTTPII